MTHDIKQLLEKASKIRMSPADEEVQRRSFAYGNSKIENDRITREMINAAADRIVPRS